MLKQGDFVHIVYNAGGGSPDMQFVGCIKSEDETYLVIVNTYPVIAHENSSPGMNQMYSFIKRRIKSCIRLTPEDPEKVPIHLHLSPKET
jgi:hypothetical protein